MLRTALCLLAFCWHASAIGIELPDLSQTEPLGLHTRFLIEAADSKQPLTATEALAAYRDGRFTKTHSEIPAFGLGSPAIWFHLQIDNPSKQAVLRRLQVENSWLDQLDVHFFNPGGVRSDITLGDAFPFAERPLAGRFLAVEHSFPPGRTDILIRAATDDPMTLPIFLLNAESATARTLLQGYAYGFLYGYLIALIAYNFMLYLSLRDQRHITYAIFIALFVMANMAYTGHGFAMLWPDSPAFQRWIIPILMVCYAIAGQVFAAYFLETKTSYPHIHRIMLYSGVAIILAMLVATLVADTPFFALAIAFAYVLLYSLLMPLLGALAVGQKHRFAPYFLAATLASAIGLGITAVAVLGIVPFSEWNFHATEIGMVIDATLLALALGSRFRSIQEQQQIAQRLAARDPLTNLFNRRAFLERARPLWSSAKRHDRQLSLIMIDIDYFKGINDQHGHAAGDSALQAVSFALNNALREGDFVARWGGEEFLLLLPETGLDAALALAERLREGIADIRLPAGNTEFTCTASFGVACSGSQESLDRLISEADHYLYQAKENGRNRVCSVQNNSKD